jgi:glycosyltransferase involved in cell wall biosynthesis
MRKIRVLHIGIKNYPFGSAFSDNNLVGLRGGGMNKYCSILIDNISDEIESFLIVQKLSNQSKYEKINGINIFRVRTKGSRRIRQILVLLKSFFLSIKVIRKYKIDVVHGHMIQGIFFAYILSLFLNVKVVGTPYSFVVIGFSKIVNSFAKFIEKNIYKRIDAIVFETEGNLKKAYELRKLRLNNAVVISTGIDMPTVTNNIYALDKINLYYIGRIVKIKALDNLINSVEYLTPTERSQIHIDIIGEGELLNEYKTLVENKGLNSFIKLHGFINDIESFYKYSSIFILPSHMEGLSISLLEAMSHGKACIVNDFGLPFSNDEIYTMPENSPKTIAAAIKYFIDNRDEIKIFGNNARNRIKSDFSITSFSHKHIAMYQKVSKI